MGETSLMPSPLKLLVITEHICLSYCLVFLISKSILAHMHTVVSAMARPGAFGGTFVKSVEAALSSNRAYCLVYTCGEPTDIRIHPAIHRYPAIYRCACHPFYHNPFIQAGSTAVHVVR